MPTPVPAAPTVPLRSQGDTVFAANAEAYLAWIADDAAPGFETLAGEAEDAATAAAASETAAAASAVTAAAEAAASAAAAVRTANTQALVTAIRNYGMMPKPAAKLPANDTPTITLGVADAGSTLTGGTASAAWNSSHFQFLGGVATKHSASYPGDSAFRSRGAYYGRNGANTSNVYLGGYSCFEVSHTGTQIEPRFIGTGNGGVNVRFLVNDCEAGSVSVPNGTGSLYRVKLVFPVSATRRITIITGQVPLMQINYGTDSGGALANTGRTYPLVTLVGDSFVEGSGASNGDYEAVVMARALGFNAALAGVGSTGMLAASGTNSGGGNKVNFTDTTRLLDLTMSGVTDMNSAAQVPKLGVVFGSINDNLQYPSATALTDAIRTATQTMIDAWVTANSGKPLVFFGPTWTSGSPTLDIYRIRDGIQEAAFMNAQSNVWFIDRLEPAARLRSGSQSRTTTTGTTSNGSAIITSIASLTNVAIGSGVTGTGIPTGARVKTVDSGTQVTLDLVATASGSGVALQFNNDQAALYTTTTDTTHPSAEGHCYDGLWCAAQLRRLILNEFA